MLIKGTDNVHLIVLIRHTHTDTIKKKNLRAQNLETHRFAQKKVYLHTDGRKFVSRKEISSFRNENAHHQGTSSTHNTLNTVDRKIWQRKKNLMTIHTFFRLLTLTNSTHFESELLLVGKNIVSEAFFLPLF